MHGRTIVYTADIGGHDNEQQHVEQTVPVEWVRFEDGPHPHELNDRLAGRWYKTHPAELFPNTHHTIWIDANVEVKSPTFVAEVEAQTDGYALFRHPDRTNVQDEIGAAATLAKYDGAHHEAMVKHLQRSLGDPTELYAMGVLSRRRCLLADWLDRLVWRETLAWSDDRVTALDQLILPFCAKYVGATLIPSGAPAIDCFDRNLWSNDWFTIHPHRRST